MKTFKQHIKEHKQGKYGAGMVGVETSDAVEDGSIGVHNIQDPDVLKRVNAFVGSVAEQEYIKPQFAVDKLLVIVRGGKDEKKPMPSEKEKALNIATS